MPEQLRSIVNRLREFVGNRRRAPRFRTRLEVELALSYGARGAKQEAAGKQLRLAGYTRDISRSGLAIIIPAIRIGGQYITNDVRTLHIVLKLSTGPVELQATPVRYRPLDEGASDTGYLIGVRIIAMSDTDRARFNACIEALRAER